MMKREKSIDVKADVKLKLLDWQMKFLMTLLLGFVAFLIVHSSQMSGFGVRLDSFVKDMEEVRKELAGTKEAIGSLEKEVNSMKGYSKSQVDILGQIRDLLQDS